jgi:hypothetical protein
MADPTPITPRPDFHCGDCDRPAWDSQWAEWHNDPCNEEGERVCDDCADERLTAERVEKPVRRVSQMMRSDVFKSGVKR